MKKFFTIRNIIIIIFVVCLCFMGFGFAKYDKSLGFSGELSIPSYFKVYISDIKKIDQEFVNASGSIQSFSDNNAVLPVTATDVLFSATYLVTVTNTYPLDMVFSGISIVPHVVSGSGTVDHYVEITNNATGEKFYPGSTLVANSDTVLKMKIYYTSDSVVSISTDVGVVAIPESQATSGSLTKGTISRTTGSFDDHRTPECYTVDFINSYSFENVVGISLNNANYKVVKPNGKDFGNVQIPANSEKEVDFCVVPAIKLTNRTDNVKVSYVSYSSGETFSDNLVLSVVTLIRTFNVTTNMYDGIILCNNVTTGQYNIISSTKSGSAEAKIGDVVECSAGDGNVTGYGSNNDYYYTDGFNNYSSMWYNKWTIEDTNASLNQYAPLVCRGCGETIKYNQSLNSNTAHTVATTGTYSVPKSGYYLIELWGGAGGSGHNYSKDLGGKGGNSGYTYGFVYLNKDQTFYYTLGGDGKKGENGKNEVGAGGANGGGVNSCTDCSYNSGGGGGWSALFDTSTTGTLLLLSAGGGAGGGPAWIAGSMQAGDGGAGGNVLNAISNASTWTASNTKGTIIFGSNGGKSDGGVYGTGGNTAPGYNISDTTNTLYIGSAFVEGNANHSGVGGSSRYHGAPGGGGYFGGGGGMQRNNKDTIAKDGQKVGGGGGGSSFINSTFTYNNLSNIITTQLVTNRPGEKNGDGGGAIIFNYLFDTLDGI